MDQTSTVSQELESELAQLSLWLDEFKRDRGRPLRVLHVGNIAANGYLNAKFLRRVGVEADVLCRDYNHVMAMPEWEDVELRHPHGDDNNPVFDKADIGDFEQPDWFIHGPMALCVEKIAARYGNSSGQADSAKWRLLDGANRISRSLLGPSFGKLTVLALTSPLKLVRKAFARLVQRTSPTQTVAKKAVAQIDALSGMPGRAAVLVEAFRNYFPNRPDKLVGAELAPYLGAQSEYERLFAPYDIVQCYATEPIFALVSDKRPYVAFEHGTLRHFTTEDEPLHRLTALAYRHADHTFITNGDCLAYAEMLGIKTFSAMVHPVDVEQHRQDFSQDAARIREELGAEILIFCPVRHDYAIKGTDRAIKALPLIKARTDKRVVMILSTWGEQVGESRAMVDALGCTDDVVWRAAMCRIAMIKHIQAADVVFDQFVLPVFGSTAPQTIAAGRPVLASYDPSKTEWLIPEPAPIVSAFTAEEIADRTIECLDPAWRADYEVRARNWIDRYHSPKNVIRDHLKVYRGVL